MSESSLFIAVIMVVFALIVVAVSIKSGKPVKSLLLTALSGVGSLFAVNIISPFTGVVLAVNYLTLLIGAIGGIPGIVSLLICNIILR